MFPHLETWLEQSGEVELIGGWAHIALAADFAAAIDTSNYQVFTSSYDAVPVFVTNRSATGFEIHVMAGRHARHSPVRCAWNVVARTRDAVQGDTSMPWDLPSRQSADTA